MHWATRSPPGTSIGPFEAAIQPLLALWAQLTEQHLAAEFFHLADFSVDVVDVDVVQPPRRSRLPGRFLDKNCCSRNRFWPAHGGAGPLRFGSQVVARRIDVFGPFRAVMAGRIGTWVARDCHIRVNSQARAAALVLTPFRVAGWWVST